MSYSQSASPSPLPDILEFKHDDLLLECKESVALLTLNRPDARNAYSTQMIDGLMKAFDLLELDPAIRCVMITGAGTAFSAGGDLKLMLDKEGMFKGGAVELRTRYMQEIQRVPRRINRFSKPLIAVLNGPAIGAGFDLSLMCDLRIASTKARFGSTFVKVGLVPGDGGAYFLSKAVGLGRALELMMTGRLLSAQEADQWGLLNRVVDPDSLLDTAFELAKSIAQNAPLAVQLTKSAAYQSQHLSVDAALNLAASYQGVVQNTQDHLEGVRAILERRPPQFKGQ